jgi:hypothetical protein
MCWLFLPSFHWRSVSRQVGGPEGTPGSVDQNFELLMLSFLASLSHFGKRYLLKLAVNFCEVFCWPLKVRSSEAVLSYISFGFSKGSVMLTMLG